MNFVNMAILGASGLDYQFLSLVTGLILTAIAVLVALNVFIVGLFTRQRDKELSNKIEVLESQLARLQKLEHDVRNGVMLFFEEIISRDEFQDGVLHQLMNEMDIDSCLVDGYVDEMCRAHEDVLRSYYELSVQFGGGTERLRSHISQLTQSVGDGGSLEVLRHLIGCVDEEVRIDLKNGIDVLESRLSGEE